MERTVTVAQMERWLEDCLAHPEEITCFVMGHAAPDTDTVVSSLAEAYRRTRAGEPGVAPLVQSDRLPREIAWLLGESGRRLPLAAQPVFARRMVDAAVRFVLTDHQEEGALTPRVIGVVDHHPQLPGVILPADSEVRTVGAATSLVALRWQRAGLVPEAPVARWLLGAVLADTEGLSPSKTRPEDADAARWLTALAETDPTALFAALREQLLAETDLETLYRRDYRSFAGLGFAILKVRADAPVDIPALKALLETDRRQQGHRLCLAKVARYGDGGLREETYYIAAATPGEAARALTVLQRAAAGTAQLSADGGLYIAPDGKHLSRKRLVPLLLAEK